MFGKKKKSSIKKIVENVDSYEDLEENVNPEDLIDDEFVEDETYEDSKQPSEQVKQPVRVTKSTSLSKPTPKQQVSQVQDVQEDEGITEEQVLSIIGRYGDQLREFSQVIRVLMQRSDIIEDRLKSLESSIFRIRNS